MTVIADTFITETGPTNGAIVYAYMASRFATVPIYGSQPPAGAPDAGPVTTGTQYGGSGQFQLTVPSDVNYYALCIYDNNNYWQLVQPIDAGGGGGGGGGAVSSVSGDGTTTTVSRSTGDVVVSVLGGVYDASGVSAAETVRAEAAESLVGNTNASWAFVHSPETVKLVAYNARKADVTNLRGDVICRGYGDETSLATAIAMLPTISGTPSGKIVLSEGVFVGDGPAYINGQVEVEGQGRGTKWLCGPVTGTPVPGRTGTPTNPRRAAIIVGQTANQQSVHISKMYIGSVDYNASGLSPATGFGSAIRAHSGGSLLIEEMMIALTEYNGIELSSYPILTDAYSGHVGNPFYSSTLGAGAGGTWGASGVAPGTVENWVVGTTTFGSGVVSDSLASPLTNPCGTFTYATSASHTASPFAILRINAPGDGGTSIFYEEIGIQARVDGTHFQVIRGYNGTPVLAHVAGETAVLFTRSTTYLNDIDRVVAQLIGQDGLSMDPCLSDSTITKFEAQGGASPGGRYGIYDRSGTAKHVNNHPFLFGSHGFYYDALTNYGNPRIQGGDFESNGGSGIHLEGITQAAVEGPVHIWNNCSAATGTYNGITLKTATASRIQGPECDNQKVGARFAIELVNSTGCEVTGVRTDHGIGTSGTSDNNYIHHNTRIAGTTYTTPQGIVVAGAHSRSERNVGVTVLTPGTSNVFAWGSWPDIQITAGTTVQMVNGIDYTFNGSSASTFTLPGTIQGARNRVFNRGTAIITVTINDFGTIVGPPLAAYATYNVVPGQGVLLECDGYRWNIVSLAAATELTGTYANIPAASVDLNGLKYFATDTLTDHIVVGGAWVTVSQAFPSVIANYSSGAVSASISSASVIASLPATGTYRLSYVGSYSAGSGAGTISLSNATVAYTGGDSSASLVWADFDTDSTQSVYSNGPASGGAQPVTGSLTFRGKTATAVTISMTYSASGVTSPAYVLVAVLERLA